MQLKWTKPSFFSLFLEARNSVYELEKRNANQTFIKPYIFCLVICFMLSF